LVLTLDILAVRSAQRALTIFDRLGYQRSKVKLVINKWSKQSNLELRHVERYLGEKIAGFISNDYAAAINSVNLGQPLAGGSYASPVVAEIKRLATIYGAAAPEPAHGGVTVMPGPPANRALPAGPPPEPAHDARYQAR